MLRRLLLYGLCLLTGPFVWGQQRPLEKTSPHFDRSLRTTTPENFSLVVADVPTFRAWLEGEKIAIVRTYTPANIVVVRTTRTLLQEKILPRTDVLFADQIAAPHEELPVPGHNLFVNQIAAAQVEFPLLNGTGSTISIQEEGFDTSDVDFRHRAFRSSTASAHLTTHANIMATLVAGAGNSDPAGRGVAWGARLVSSGFNQLLPDDPADYAALAINVQNHSYGLGIENYYGAQALAFDRSTLDRPTLLHVFSAGNMGVAAAGTGPYAGLSGFANLTGNFKMAKNVLTVGAVDSFGRVEAFSSRGPAYDGRLKPDLAAFGNDGSSGAAALVSGAAAVLQQAVRDQSGVLPPAALVRAILLNSARDIAPSGPDFSTGFGSLDLRNALQTVSDQHFVTADIQNGETHTFPFNLPAGMRHLQFMLAWDDPPAMPNAFPALVNDLDITVLAPDGSVWRPWRLNPTPNADSLRLPATRGRDSLNNVELVGLDFPLPGEYTVKITGMKVPASPQPFALVWNWAPANRFRWTFPVHRDPVVAGRDVILRWESTFTDSVGQLAYRAPGTSAWAPIDSGVDLRTGYFRWLPAEVFSEAQVRMRVNGQDFDSDTFLISPEVRVHVGVDCPDSVMLYWNSAGPNARYALSGLGDRYLEPLQMLPDTFVVLQKADFPQKRFSIDPLGPEGAVGLRSAAPDVEEQGVGCYIANFGAERTADLQVAVHLTVGTWYGLQSATLEKGGGGTFSPLQTWGGQPATTFDWTDPSPSPGINRYRARLDLQNGAVLYSEVAAVYLPGADGLLVFPNPLPVGRALEILTDAPDATVFRLFDGLGRQVLETNIPDIRAEIGLPGVRPGVYPYVLTKNGRTYAGKLTVTF